MQISNVADDHISKLEKKYAVGKKVRARVIGFRVMDALAIVSLKVLFPLFTHSTFFNLAGYLHSENLFFIPSLCLAYTVMSLSNQCSISVLNQKAWLIQIL